MVQPGPTPSPPPAEGIPIYPIQTAFQVLPIPQSPQGPLILWQIFTPTGKFAVFTDPDAADRIAESAQRASQAARTGIVVPTLDLSQLRDLNGQDKRG